jgi:exosortase/archaeosortase family protein
MSSTVNVIRKYWAEFPLLLRKFFIKALLLLLIWELSFQLYLKPHRTIDLPLTAITTATTVGFLRLFYEKQSLSWENGEEGTAYILLNGQRTIGIADTCNGLELFILYVGFIICIPTSFKRAAIFITLGIVVIFILNILRCSGMFWFNLHRKEWFDFAHHYAFKIIVYAAIFGGWVWYCRKINNNG